MFLFFFFQAEDGIRDHCVTGVQTCALPICQKSIDVIIMFKLLIIQRLYNISDEQLEYQVNDHLLFMKFLGMGIEDKIPDGKTVWLFRKQLTEKGDRKSVV